MKYMLFAAFVLAPLAMKLEILRLHIGEDNDVVLFQNLLVLPRRYVVKVPRRNADDFVSPARLHSPHQPLTVVDKINPLGAWLKDVSA